MATAEDYAAWIVKNSDKKGTPDFDVVARAYAEAKTVRAPTEKALDPSEGGNELRPFGISTGVMLPQGVSRALAGAGKAFSDAGTGLQQVYAGAADLVAPRARDASSVITGQSNSRVAELRRQVEETRRRDAPLMDTGTGLAGNIGGNVAMALAPGGALKGAGVAARALGAPALATSLSAAGGAALAPTTVKSALALGAGMGAIQPSASTGETVGNTAVGAAAAALPQVAVRGYQAAKAAVEPFYESGKNQILGRLLNRVAGNGAADAARKLETAGTPFAGPTAQGEAARATMGEIVPGSAPTVGQVSGNPGLAALERTASQTDPQVMNQYAQRMAQQNTARTGVLDEMAGTDGARDMFDAARTSIGNQLYGDAFSTGIVQSRVTPAVQSAMNKLAQRPIIQDAIKEAQLIAKNDGMDLSNAAGSLEGLHYAKIALDNAMERGGTPATALARKQMRQLAQAKDDLIGVIDRLSPKYASARAEYEAASKPLNRMDIAETLTDKAVNKLTGTLQPAAFAKALTDKTAAKATGFKGATLEGVMEPRQLQSLASLKDDLANSVYAQNAGRGVGSDTIQKLAYSNMIDAAGIPNFIRNMAPGQIIGNLAGRGADALYGRANRELGQKLGEVMLDPATAAKLMQMAPVERSRILEVLARGGSAAGLAVPAIATGQK